MSNEASKSKLESSKPELKKLAGPIILKSDRIAAFDVDQTLLMWDDVESYDKTVTINGRKYGVNERMINRLKDHYSIEGHLVVVHSRSGYKHAVKAVKALKLWEYVHVIQSKFSFLYDDAPLSDSFPKTQYVGPLPTNGRDSIPGEYNALTDLVVEEVEEFKIENPEDS